MPGSFAPTITVVPSLAPTPRPNPFNSASSEWSEIWTTCQLNVFVFCVLVAIFWHQRLRDDVFQPRAKYRPERVPPECAAGLRALWRVFRIDDARLQRHVGLDAFVLIRFLRLWKRLAFAMSAFSAMVLVPVYMAEDGTRGQAGFDKFTMGNLKYGSPRLWAPFTFTWLLALFAAHLLENEGKLYTRLRHRFLARGDDDDGPQPRCSVVVERAPARNSHLRHERFGRASRTRREPSMRPKISRINLTELESSEVRRGPPDPAVDVHTGTCPRSCGPTRR